MYTRSSPNADFASEAAVWNADGSSSAVRDQAHSLPSASRRRLDQEREIRAARTKATASSTDVKRTIASRGQSERPPSPSPARARVLSPIIVIAEAGRPDEDEPRTFDRISEGMILREKSVPRMNRIRPRSTCRVDDRVGVEIAQGRLRRPDMHRHVRRADVRSRSGRRPRRPRCF